MTGACESVQIAPYSTAISLVLRLSTPLFLRWAHSDQEEFEEANFKHWSALRRIATIYFERRSTELRPEERETMVGALQFAHRSHHEAVPALRDIDPSAESCHCEVARTLRDLAEVLNEAELPR